MTGQGLIIMVVGLGVVFTFLLVLVAMMTISSKLFIRFAHLMPEAEPAGGKSASASARSDDGAVIAAMIAAIHARRP